MLQGLSTHALARHTCPLPPSPSPRPVHRVAHALIEAVAAAGCPPSLEDALPGLAASCAIRQPVQCAALATAAASISSDLSEHLAMQLVESMQHPAPAAPSRAPGLPAPASAQPSEEGVLAICALLCKQPACRGLLPAWSTALLARNDVQPLLRQLLREPSLTAAVEHSPAVLQALAEARLAYLQALQPPAFSWAQPDAVVSGEWHLQVGSWLP